MTECEACRHYGRGCHGGRKAIVCRGTDIALSFTTALTLTGPIQPAAETLHRQASATDSPEPRKVVEWPYTIGGTGIPPPPHQSGKKRNLPLEKSGRAIFGTLRRPITGCLKTPFLPPFCHARKTPLLAQCLIKWDLWWRRQWGLAGGRGRHWQNSASDVAFGGVCVMHYKAMVPGFRVVVHGVTWYAAANRYLGVSSCALTWRQ